MRNDNRKTRTNVRNRANYLADFQYYSDPPTNYPFFISFLSVFLHTNAIFSVVMNRISALFRQNETRQTAHFLKRDILGSSGSGNNGTRSSKAGLTVTLCITNTRALMIYRNAILESPVPSRPACRSPVAPLMSGPAATAIRTDWISTCSSG